MTLELGKPPKASPLTEEGRRTARRAFLTGSLAAAPVITTLASRPAWAGCGLVSVMYSATYASHAAEVTCFGQANQYWRMNPDLVGLYVAEVGPANPMDYNNLITIPTDYSYPTEDELEAALSVPGGNQKHKDAIKQYRDWLNMYGSTRPMPPFGTKFNEIFGSYADENLTIMQALWREDWQLLCQSACAWLNANEYPGGFGYTTEEVIAHFQTTGMDDPALLTAAFTAMNTASLTVGRVRSLDRSPRRRRWPARGN